MSSINTFSLMAVALGWPLVLDDLGIFSASGL
jgi:hypothetical protein